MNECSQLVLFWVGAEFECQRVWLPCGIRVRVKAACGAAPMLGCNPGWISPSFLKGVRNEALETNLGYT